MEKMANIDKFNIEQKNLELWSEHRTVGTLGTDWREIWSSRAVNSVTATIATLWATRM